MAAIILPGRWRKQPTGPVEIDYRNPLASGLIFAPDLSLPLRIDNAVTRQPATANANPGSIVVTNLNQWGPAVVLSPQYGWYVDAAIPTADRVTLFGISTGRTDGSLLLSYGNSGSAARHSISWSAANPIAFSHDGTASSSAFSGATTSNGIPAAVCAVFAGATSRKIYVNGKLQDTSTTSRTIGAGGRLYIGCDYTSGGLDLTVGFTGAPLAWSRALSDGEVSEITLNPWQVFKKKSRIIYFHSAGGGGATLTADSGSYSLTGTAATLAVGRKLTAESGTYSVTGTSVDFLRGYSLTAESGGYSVSGTDAAIKLGRLLAAESGSYTLTGTDVTLTYQQAGSYSLTADAGSYALTGTAAALRVTRTLTAEAGSYSLTGADVTLRRGYAVQADTGSYALTGAAVAFARTYVLGAESGSYTLTGSDVGLTWSAAPVVETPTHGGPSIYGKAVFREKEFRREYDEQIRRIDEAKLAERLIREDEELIIIMAALAA